MSISVLHVAGYLERYIAAYREEYDRFTTPPPTGGGYPTLAISPYLYARELECFLSPDGVIISVQAEEPNYSWWIAGGPALMADFPESRTPPEIVESLKAEGIGGQNIGIYRLAAKSETGIPDELWEGRLPPVREEIRRAIKDTTITVHGVETPFIDVLRRLTFGTLGLLIDIHLPENDSDFWLPHIVRNIGFLTADRKNRRFVNYLEITPHTEEAAWDIRNLTVRVQADVRRDFAWAFSQAGRGGGGSIAFGLQSDWVAPFYDRLSRLADIIEQFASLLEDRGVEDESVFHNFIEANPILLDVYGEAVPKPRFHYPEEASPLGKLYVEPDFIIKYPGRQYKLVELERPAKRIATERGHPRAEVTQAAFQIGEWRAYIANHYELVRQEFPGISIANTAMVVISRTTAENYGAGHDPRKYQEILQSMYTAIEIVTYDDLLERAIQAYVRLASLGPSVARS